MEKSLFKDETTARESAMNFLTKALSAGLTADAILQHVKKSSPKYRKKIEEALQDGFTSDQIVQFLHRDFKGLSKTKKAGQLVGESGTKPSAYQRSRAHELRTKRGDRLAKTIGGLAVGGLGAAAGKVASSVIPTEGWQSGFENLAPEYINQTAQGQNPQIGNMTKQIGMDAATGNNPSNMPPGRGPTAPINSVPQEMAPTPKVNHREILEETGLIKNVTHLVQVKKSPEDIGALVDQYLTTPGQKKWAKQQGIDLGSIAKEYAEQIFQAEGAEGQASQDGVRGEAPVVEAAEGKGDEEKDPVPFEDERSIAELESKFAESPQQGAPAYLANGDMGEIKEIRGEKAIVDVNGKEKHVPLRDIAQLGPEDSADLDRYAEELVNLIPEHERSTAAIWINDLPGNRMMVQYTSDPKHFFIYDNVTPDMVKHITSASVAPKGSGKNKWGEYIAGSPDSRGSPLSEISQNKKKHPFIKIPIVHHNLMRLFEALSPKKKRKNEKAR